MSVPTSSAERLVQADGAESGWRNWRYGPPFAALALTVVFLGFLLVPRVRGHAGLVGTFSAVGGLLLAWQAWLAWRCWRSGRRLRFEARVVASHYVQALVQFSIYAAFGWYWRPVYDQAPLILSQIVFLYIFDMLLSWSRRDVWRLGFGPFPIVLSTNLFMWFRDDLFFCQFLMVALGALGKEFIVWTRDGRRTHIFNPSALGLSVVSLVLIATGTTDGTWAQDLAVRLNRPPYIFVHIFLIGLIVQYFFGVTLMTLAAAGFLFAVNTIYTQATGSYHFIDSNIPIAVFLGLHLLMTDPATTPRSNLGKVLYGAGYGLAVFLLYEMLRYLGAPRFYDKLLGVPLLNLAVPWIDRLARLPWATRLMQWESRYSPKALNLGHMACWILVFGTMLATGFVQSRHPGSNVTFWEQACAEDRAHACDNLVHVLSTQCDDGSGAACNRLATLLADGRLVPANAPVAATLFARACDLGDFNGCINTAMQYVFQGQAISHEAARRALERLSSDPATATHATASYVVAAAYESGRGLEVNAENARVGYTRACDQGEWRACKPAARMEFHGQGGPIDRVHAADHLNRCCDAEDVESCLQLARMLHDGLGVPTDEPRARSLLSRACDLGHAGACALLKSLEAVPLEPVAASR